MSDKTLSLDNVHIGQTIFIVLNDSLKIVPAVVAEKTHIETLTESSVVWKVMVGPAGEKRKVIALDKISGDKFATLEEAKQEILNSFHESLDEEVEDTIEKTMTWYNIPRNRISINSIVAEQAHHAVNQMNQEDIFDPASLLVTPFQKEAKKPGRPPKQQQPSSTPLVKFDTDEMEKPAPPKKPAKIKPSTMKSKPTNAQEALRAALGGDDDEDDDGYVYDAPTEGEANVVMPDGERIRVKL